MFAFWAREQKRRLRGDYQLASRAAPRSENERWSPCPAEKAANHLILSGVTRARRAFMRGPCGNGVIGARKAGGRSAPLLGIANPSDEPHAQRRNRRSAGLHAIWAVPPIRLRIRAMEPMPSGGMGSRDVEVRSQNPRNNLTQKVAPVAQARTLPEPAGDGGPFADLSTMSKIRSEDI